MTWWTATSVSVNSGQTIVNVNTGDDVQIAQEAGGLVIGNQPPVEIKRTFLDGGGLKKIELRQPWPYANQTTQPAVAFPTDADLAEATRVLRAVGSDAVTFAEALSQVLSSTASTLTIKTETSGDVTVVPYGRLTQQVQTLLNTFGDFGVPLYDTDTKNQARTLLGLQPQITPEPILDFDFTNNTYKVYEKYGPSQKSILEAINFTRSSAATTTTPVGLVNLASNEPAIEFNRNSGQSRGLRCYDQRTNLVLNSKLLGFATDSNSPGTNWSFFRNDGTQVVTVSELSSQRLRFQTTLAANRRVIQQTFTLVAGTTYTLSLYINAFELISGNNEFVRINGAGMGVALTITAANAVIGRNTITFTALTSDTLTVRIGVGCLNDAIGTLDFAMPQLEAGDTASSYIETDASAVTRNIDNAVRTNSYFGPFTIYAEFFDETLGSDTQSIKTPVCLTNPAVSSNSGFGIVLNQNGSSPRRWTGRLRDGVIDVSTPDIIGGVANGWNKFAITYNPISRIISFALNGVDVSSSVYSGNFNNQFLESINFARSNPLAGSGTRFRRGTLHRNFKMYAHALTSDERIDLTRL